MFVNWWGNEFWRFVFVQKEVAQYAQTFLDFPPMQKGASFNLQQPKEELDKKMASHESQQNLREFWRFVQEQKAVSDLAEAVIEYPPMQEPASSTLDVVKRDFSGTPTHGIWKRRAPGTRQ